MIINNMVKYVFIPLTFRVKIEISLSSKL